MYKPVVLRRPGWYISDAATFADLHRVCLSGRYPRLHFNGSGPSVEQAQSSKRICDRVLSMSRKIDTYLNSLFLPPRPSERSLVCLSVSISVCPIPVWGYFRNTLAENSSYLVKSLVLPGLYKNRSSILRILDLKKNNTLTIEGPTEDVKLEKKPKTQ